MSTVRHVVNTGRYLQVRALTEKTSRRSHTRHTTHSHLSHGIGCAIAAAGRPETHWATRQAETPGQAQISSQAEPLLPQGSFGSALRPRTESGRRLSKIISTHSRWLKAAPRGPAGPAEHTVTHAGRASEGLCKSERSSERPAGRAGAVGDGSGEEPHAATDTGTAARPRSV